MVALVLCTKCHIECHQSRKYTVKWEIFTSSNFRCQYQSAKIKIREIFSDFLQIRVEELVAYMVAVCGSYMYFRPVARPVTAICLYKLHLMRDYLNHEWPDLLNVTLINFLLFLTALFYFLHWQECLHLYYVQNTRRVVLLPKVCQLFVWHKVQVKSKQDTIFIFFMFWSHFIKLSACKYVFLFVCPTFLLTCVSGTLAGDFLSV